LQRAFVSGLRRSYLDRRPVLGPGTFSQRVYGLNVLPHTLQVYWLHSWRFGANEVAVPSKGKLAFSCLMGARRVDKSRPYALESANQFVASILETRESAAYSSQCRKKRVGLSGESGPYPHPDSEQPTQALRPSLETIFNLACAFACVVTERTLRCTRLRKSEERLG